MIAMGQSSVSVGAVAILACVAALPAEAGLKALKGFDKDLAAHGVPEGYSGPGLEALLALVRDEIAEVDRRIAQATGEDQEQLRGIADAARGVLERATALTASSDPAAASSGFAALKSLLYSMRSEVRGEQGTCLIADIVRLLGNMSLKIPYLSPQDRARPLTPDQAALEAANLVDPRTGTEYSDPVGLSGLSPEHVAELDVRRDDYLWHDEIGLSALKARHGTAWRALEARTETRVSEALHAPYSLSEARRILLFRGIRSTATTAKIDTEDLHGQGWKVKWGEEVHAEPIANHLYVELGGKFADLVYANKGGPADLVLVMNESDPRRGETCESIATLDQLKHCLRVSKYKFDVSAHVVSHGVISESTLREEPFASASGPTADLIGREFVTFNESLVEFQSGADGFEPLGAAPMSSSGARSHRAKRGLAVFTYWIHNKDAKDANSKGVIDVASSTYVEYIHDMGASQGSLKYSGNPNLLKVGDDFVRRRSDNVKFSSNMLYLPKAFDAATYADAVWMVRKITGLSREDILAAVATTRWPDFQQDVVASRLIARRNAIARAFEVDASMTFDATPTVVSLRTAADRLAAVTRYQLSIATQGDAEKAKALLEEFMGASGIVMRDGLAEFEDRTTESTGESEEMVLETTKCKRSILVAWLERTIHPAGLSRRLYRRADDKPLKACQPTRKSLHLRD
jgi:hypothetical protein